MSDLNKILFNNDLPVLRRLFKLNKYYEPNEILNVDGVLDNQTLLFHNNDSEL